jgi:5-formyltetrahydrofolate cyclo-ligase
VTDDILAAKQELRRTMAPKRDAIGLQARAQAATALAALVMSQIAFETDAVIGGYFPFRSEFDVHPLLRVLGETGRTIALPVVIGAQQPLSFRRYRLGDTMSLNRLGIPEPSEQAPEVTPTHLLVPLLAFDDRFYRLGYGGGYYDRTLATLQAQGRSPISIGIGYEVQRVPSVPHGPQDHALDMVASEVVLRRAGERERGAK